MKSYLSLIKFSHTIFALPFALIGFTLGFVQQRPENYAILLLCVVLCMVFGRSAAMAFNRWLDRDIDATNPRTIQRELPAGIITAKSALWFVITNCLLFVLTTYFINPLCFALSPIALIVILGYSYTKRFTLLCHLVLGIGLALAPVGAYLAIVGRFDIVPVLIGLGVMFWVAGFDIIYALQDQEFDKSKGLNSIPVLFGTAKSMRISELFHVFTAILMTWALYLIYLNTGMLSNIGILGMIVFLCLLIYQHIIISVDDLSRVNVSFFTTNGLASVVFGTLLIFDLLF
ncbi:MAG: UbiA-like polyprenyltransferase [Saprospiraceae bacterium]